MKPLCRPLSAGEKRKRKPNSLYKQCKHMKPFWDENSVTIHRTVTSNKNISCKTSFNLCLAWSTKKQHMIMKWFPCKFYG